MIGLVDLTYIINQNVAPPSTTRSVTIRCSPELILRVLTPLTPSRLLSLNTVEKGTTVVHKQGAAPHNHVMLATVGSLYHL